MPHLNGWRQLRQCNCQDKCVPKCSICLARSSTSKQPEGIESRELVRERLRLVPKGHWKLAGGANHRFVVNIESEPRKGRRKSRDAVPAPLPGLVAFRGSDRWFAPPANFRDASGGRY